MIHQRLLRQHTHTHRDGWIDRLKLWENISQTLKCSSQYLLGFNAFKNIYILLVEWCSDYLTSRCHPKHTFNNPLPTVQMTQMLLEYWSDEELSMRFVLLFFPCFDPSARVRNWTWTHSNGWVLQTKLTTITNNKVAAVNSNICFRKSIKIFSFQKKKLFTSF